MASPIKLEPGHYIIQNVGTRLYIGRNPSEDTSTRPKHIVSLPGGVEAPRWVVQVLSNGRYYLRIGPTLNVDAAPTGVIGHDVVAFIVDQQEAREWALESGELAETYSISSKNGEEWSLPGSNPYTQVDAGVKDIPINNELWRFTKIPLKETANDESYALAA